MLNDNTKVALVTGGSRGIGAAISLALGKEGYYVVVNYNHNESHANNIVNQITENGGHAMTIQGNIAESTDCKSGYLFAIKTIDDKFIGTLGLDYTKEKMNLSQQSINEIEKHSSLLGGVLMTY